MRRNVLTPGSSAIGPSQQSLASGFADIVTGYSCGGSIGIAPISCTALVK